MLGASVNTEWDAALAETSREPRFEGRHVVLPPVHPDDVRSWAASADVSIIAVPANSLNQRLSTPNKFWESLAAGTPVVIGRDLEVMRAIVEEDGLGAVADPDDPDDLARALREVLEQPPDDYAAMRERCLAVTRDRYNWETAVEPYLELIARLAAGPAGRSHPPTGPADPPPGAAGPAEQDDLARRRRPGRQRHAIEREHERPDPADAPRRGLGAAGDPAPPAQVAVVRAARAGLDRVVGHRQRAAQLDQLQAGGQERVPVRGEHAGPGGLGLGHRALIGRVEQDRLDQDEPAARGDQRRDVGEGPGRTPRRRSGGAGRS